MELQDKKQSPNATVESKLDNLAIELPDLDVPSYEENTEIIRDLLCSYMEAKYKLLKSDKPEDTRTSIIYLMKCNNSNCDRNLYIGYTHCGHETRFKKHTSSTNSRGKENPSAVYKHIRDTCHSFNIEDMKILEVCCDHNKLRILESLYIKEYLLKRNKLLNKASEEKQLALFAYTKEERTKAAEFLNA